MVGNTQDYPLRLVIVLVQAKQHIKVFFICDNTRDVPQLHCLRRHHRMVDKQNKI